MFIEHSDVVFTSYHRQVHTAVAGNAARVPMFQHGHASGLCQLPGVREVGRLQPGRDVTRRGGIQAQHSATQGQTNPY
jgi:hypothetical protein